MNQKVYIKKVSKKLKCSKAKKREIEKQLESDIGSALENGETLEQVCKRMGVPKEAAAEFNENLSEDEMKKAKREKIYKIIAIIVGLLLVLGLLVYWAFPKMKSIEESKIFEEEQLESMAMTVILALYTKDYETLQSEYAGDVMKPYLTEEYMEQAKKDINADWDGQMVFGNAYMVEITQMGKKFATVQMSVNYENVSVTYTLSFDSDYKLIGLYMR